MSIPTQLGVPFTSDGERRAATQRSSDTKEKLGGEGVVQEEGRTMAWHWHAHEASKSNHGVRYCGTRAQAEAEAERMSYAIPAVGQRVAA